MTKRPAAKVKRPPVRLSAKTLKTLEGPTNGRAQVIHIDRDLPGFGLRITKGARSLILTYWARGVERRMTLDSIPAGAGAEEIDRIIGSARKKAERIKSAAKYEGVDPMGAKHEDRQKQTMADLADRYLEQHAPKKRASSQADDRRMLKNHILPTLKNKRVEEISHSDVDGLHRKITKTAPITANRTVSLLSKMFSLAIRWGWRTDNPAKGVERNPENRRQRYLKAAELDRLTAALVKAKPQSSANAVRLLMLTGARRGEVLSATWSQFDLADGVWTKPSAHTKQKKEHVVPLPAPARLLLSEMHAAAVKAAKKANVDLSPFLFPGAGTTGPQANLKHFWAAVCREAKIKDVRLHDLRHTYASLMASSGFSLEFIGALLGHTNPATTARYTHLLDHPLRAAAERVGAILTANSGDASAEVIPIRGKK